MWDDLPMIFLACDPKPLRIDVRPVYGRCTGAHLVLARMLRAGSSVEFAEFGCHFTADVARVHGADRLDE